MDYSTKKKTQTKPDSRRKSKEAGKINSKLVMVSQVLKCRPLLKYPTYERLKVYE